MRMTSLLASTFLAVALGSSAAMATPFQPFGTGGQANTDEKSYESLVQNVGDVLNGIFKVSSIDNIAGNTYTPGLINSPPYITGVFSGFTLAQINPVSGGFQLLFTGGALNYYANNNNLFSTQLNALLKQSPTLANQAAAMNILATSAGTTNILSLKPEVISNAGLAHPILLPNVTLEIDLTGSSVTSFVAASTQSVFLDIVGGTMAGIFDQDTFVNSFTGALADAVYQGSANTSQCITGQPEWQVCGTNHATLSVVPEPITLSLFGAGLAGAAAVRRRKAKKA